MYRRDDAAGTVRWYIMDGLGSVVGEVDPSGNLTCSRGYDVYGATRSQTGTPTSKHGFVGKLGHETEDTSGLVYMRARWYDAACGRFVSEDPGRDGENWFVYAANDPTCLVDATGCFVGALGLLALVLLVCLLLEGCSAAPETWDGAREIREFREGRGKVEAGWWLRRDKDLDPDTLKETRKSYIHQHADDPAPNLPDAGPDGPHN